MDYVTSTDIGCIDEQSWKATQSLLRAPYQPQDLIAFPCMNSSQGLFRIFAMLTYTQQSHWSVRCSYCVQTLNAVMKTVCLCMYVSALIRTSCQSKQIPLENGALSIKKDICEIYKYINSSVTITVARHLNSTKQPGSNQSSKQRPTQDWLHAELLTTGYKPLNFLNKTKLSPSGPEPSRITDNKRAKVLFVYLNASPPLISYHVWSK